MDLLRELCECSGIPGREERLREIVRRELAPLADEINVDALGNVIARKGVSAAKGKRPPRSAKTPARKLMIAAHMDEIGFVVSHVDDKGWVRLVPVGGHDPRNMVAQRVTVFCPKGDLPGVLHPGVRPPHLASAEDRNRGLKVSDFFVDLDHAHMGRTCFDGAVTIFSRTPMRPTHAGPTLGQHTWEALRDVLGFDEDEITNLAAAGVLS